MSFLDRAKHAAAQAAEGARAAAEQTRQTVTESAGKASATMSDPATAEKARQALSRAKRGVATAIDRIDPGVLADIIIKATALQERANIALKEKGSPYRISEVVIGAAIPPSISFSIARTQDPEADIVPEGAVASVDLVVNGKVVGKVKRIKAIAASDADKKTAYFSSRGPGSSTTARNPEQYKNYPQKPDESGVGVNLVAPVPKGSNVAELGGPGSSMSGTSMSNPGVFGAFLLLTRSILVLLKDKLPVVPTAQQTQFAMDLARFAMTQTAEKVAPVDEVGDGFINVSNAFQYADKLLQDNAPSGFKARVRGLLRSFMGFAPSK